MSSLLLPLATLLIDILIICLFFSKKTQINRETKLYAVLVIVNFIECLFNVIGIIYIRQIGEVTIASILQKIDMTMMITWVALMLIYIYNVSEFKGKNRNLKNFIVGFTVLASIITLIAPNQPIITENTIDSSGVSPIVAYITIAIFAIGIIFCVVHSIIKNKNNIFNKKYYPLYALIVLAIIGLGLRTFFPFLIFEPFMMGYVVLLMYHTIENPDLKMIEQLNIAKAKAEKANHAKTDFLSSMSHEIRTPLNAISGFSQCIESATTLEEAKENAKDIVSASEALLEIVNGVLDISKIEAGKLELTNSNYNAKDLFETTAKLVIPRMEAKGLEFRIYIADDLPEILYGDQTNLRKAVTNILTNAAKYTEKGHVSYTVNAVKNGDICRLIISVEDTGRGIKKENIDKLFTKFQRLDEDKNTTIEGTGLGLAITKQIVGMMGGKIVVQSTYGRGSKFTIALDQKIKENAESMSITYNKQNNSIDLSNKKFLIVDDNKLNLKVGMKVINSLYPVPIETVESGYECLEKIKNGCHYDLIFMDDMMPKMSGVETLQELKKIQNFTTPVIALTANAISGMREKYLENGFCEYLSKPIEKEELKRIVNNLFNDNNNQTKFKELSNYKENELNNNPHLDEVTISNIDYLKNNGIDVEEGISSFGDFEIYTDALKEFYNTIKGRINNLKLYKENNIKKYVIEANALVIDFKYLGLSKLSNVLIEHEEKSKVNDYNYIVNNLENLTIEINNVIEILKQYFEKY